MGGMKTARRFPPAFLTAVLAVVAIALFVYSQREQTWSEQKCFEVALMLDAGNPTVSQDQLDKNCSR